jgi:hypothetical protein
MKVLIKHITTYSFLGLLCIFISITGYLTIADDFRHTGEFIGVSCIFLSGIIFLLAGLKPGIFKMLAIQWVPVGILMSIPIGGILLDNMQAGFIIGLSIGIIFAFAFRKRDGPDSH